MQWPVALLPVLLFSILNVRVLGQQRILGGQDATPGEFPWVAAIWMDGVFFCSGSLLSPFYVLTAAHCVHGYKHFHVIMGAHDLHSTSKSTRQARNSTSVIVHEDYDPTSLKNDIAVLRLTLPFFLTPWVRTIRLPPLDQKNNTSDFETATLTGWGLEGNDAQDLSTKLQKLNLGVISNEYCATLFPSDAIESIHLCTMTTSDKSPCRGDSGGALTAVDAYGSRTQIGIDSFSWGKCSDGYPEVFTRVSYFVPWIQIKTNLFNLPTL